MQWYYVSAGKQNGPHTLQEMQELVRQGVIRRDTLIWTSIMNKWLPAGQVSEFLVDWGAATPSPPPVAPPPLPAGKPDTPLSPPRSDWSRPSDSKGPLPDATTPLILSIVTVLLCCNPFGIVALIYASQISGKLSAGDVEGARSCSKTAYLWLGISLVLSFIGMIISAGIFISSAPHGVRMSF